MRNSVCQSEARGEMTKAGAAQGQAAGRRQLVRRSSQRAQCRSARTVCPQASAPPQRVCTRVGSLGRPRWQPHGARQILEAARECTVLPKPHDAGLRSAEGRRGGYLACAARRKGIRESKPVGFSSELADPRNAIHRLRLCTLLCTFLLFWPRASLSKTP